MFSLFSYRSQPYQQPRSPFGSSFFTLGILSILFGIAILITPELLAYLVAGFFIFAGIWMLGLWQRMRKF